MPQVCSPCHAFAKQTSRGEKRAAVNEVNRRHITWLRRHTTKDGKETTWRPRKRHRAGAETHVLKVDNQLETGTAFGGLVYIKPDGSDKWLPKNWRTWPGGLHVSDQGSKGVAGARAMVV